MTGPIPDVVGLTDSEALQIAEVGGFEVNCISTALQEHPVEILRVIRQRYKSPNIIELVLCYQPIIWKGGGKGGIQDF